MFNVLTSSRHSREGGLVSCWADAVPTCRMKEKHLVHHQTKGQNISHEALRPGNSKANGAAEAAVKTERNDEAVLEGKRRLVPWSFEHPKHPTRGTEHESCTTTNGEEDEDAGAHK
ncbi:hypothetical protein Hamer_G020969 [Homarus americanus]|uniref:Uncharacterized protein n=1 Tax=Homarus americanus TaxID=6706 RepID=A0A8J5NAV1_HOMAM|nr:hypothetical protein Hamer_G020969 [Homarus americanus]